MRRKLLSAWLALCMLIGILPANLAFAEGEEARIGDTQYQTLAEAFTAARKMNDWNGSPVSRENPVEIDLNTDIELSDTILPDDGGYWVKKEVTWHVKLNGNSHTIKRADGFNEAMIHVAQSSTLYLENITLDGASDEKVSGSILYIGSTGWFQSSKPQKTHDNYVVIGENTVLQNNYNKYQGGAVNLLSGQLFLDGGEIKNNRSDKSGGGVYISDGEEGLNAPDGEEDKFYPAVFTMNSGEISENMAVSSYTYGGGVYVSTISQDEFENGTNSSGFIMNGGSITNNSAYDGGAVSMSNYENVQVLGGTISDNICCDESGKKTTGVTGISCNFGSSPKIGGKVTITDQIGIINYDTASGSKHGRIIVVKDLDTGNCLLPLRIRSSNANCPDGTVLAEKGDGYSGELRLSDFEWKYDSSGYENTSRMLVMSSDGSQIIAGTLKTAVQSGSVDLTYEYGVKLGELDFTGCEIYDENGENRLEGSWSITYGENESAETVPEIGSYTVNAVFIPNDTEYKKVNVKFNLNVTKLTPAYTVPQGLKAVYGQTLSDVDLDEGFAWQDSESTSVGDAGTNTFYVTYTPNDTTHYNVVRDIPVTITVSKSNSETEASGSSEVTYGETLTLTATVQRKQSNTLLLAEAAADTVDFYNGTVLLGSADVNYGESNSDSGAAYIEVKTTDKKLNIGDNTITAVYGGSVNLNGSGSESITVKLNPKTVEYTVSAQDRTYNGSAAIDVTLTPTNTETGDNVTLSAAGTLSRANAGEYTSVNLSSIALSGDDAEYYTVSETADNVSLINGIEINRAIPVVPNTPELAAVDYDPSRTLADIELDGGWTWADETAVPTVGNEGYTVYYAISDDTNYDWSNADGYDAVNHRLARTAALTVSPAAPSIAEDGTPAAARISVGQTLSASALSGGKVTGFGGTELKGTWSWKDGGKAMSDTGTFEETAVFTPEDTNYAAIETTVSVTVYRASSSGGGSGNGIIRYTVTFDTQGGSKINSVQAVRNNAVSEPDDPEREGYTFGGWFTDKACTQEFDFSTKIMNDMTLYAKWTNRNEEKPNETEQPSETEKPSETEEPEKWKNPFEDVTETDWFYEAVKYANESGLFSGTSDNAFEPNAPVTRGMLVTVLWRTERQPVVNYLMTFDDVSEDAYYAEAVRWAASEGIVKGYSDSEFAPDKFITREEMAAVINRYADYNGMSGEAGDISAFADAELVSGWARGNMEWAVGTGIISGRDGNVLDPQGNTTRAETAAIMQRLLER